MNHPIPSQSDRAAQLHATYRRRWILALILSVVGHGMLSVALRDRADFLRPSRSVVIGYQGPIKVVDLAPIEDVLAAQESIARDRKERGALVNEEIDVEPEEPVRAVEDAPLIDPGVERPLPPQPRPVGPDKPIVIELGEDFRARASTADRPQSEEFVVNRIVRPDYPDQAIRDQIEGLVKLEVQVGISGRVLGVKVVESSAGSSLLERAACEAMFQWEFRPFQIGPHSVPFTILVPFRFRLE